MSTKVIPIIDECCICLDPITPDTCQKLRCNHNYHKKCIFKWCEKEHLEKHYTKWSNIELHGKCPMCRREQTFIIYGKDSKCCIS